MAAVHSSAAGAASMVVPRTQNTAPVLEFRCLYTPDIRRKQKRWQDGRLKFHTFNKRVMVYDERSNFVGDTHWREDCDIEDGEELELERGGILVQVADLVGRRDQDLSEIVDKRIKEKEDRAAAKQAASPIAGRAHPIFTPAPHLKPKPLNALLTPSGHYGRALISNTSPYEDRQHRSNVDKGERESDRPAKRRKHDDKSSQSRSGYAQNLMGAALTLTSSRPQGTPSIRYEEFKTQSSLSRSLPRTVDLTLEDNDCGHAISKDATISNRLLEGRQSAPLHGRHMRSPPTKSTYASNLTGTALTLARPGPIAARRTIDLDRDRSGVPQDNLSASTQEDGSFHDIDSSTEQLPSMISKGKKLEISRSPCQLSSSSSPPSYRVSKQVSDRKKPTVVTTGSSRASSPGAAQAASKPAKSPSTKRVSKQSPPVRDPTPPRHKEQATARKAHVFPGRTDNEQPKSSLRIKAKPRRQMMMLIDRPSSRPTLQENTPKVRDLSKSQVNQADLPGEIMLSQATRQLNEFCQKQEDRLQARLNRLHPPSHLELDNLGSPPLDRGINHREIDKLSRPCVSKSTTAAVTPPNNEKPQSFAEKDRSNAQLSQNSNKYAKNMRKATEVSLHRSSKTLDSTNTSTDAGNEGNPDSHNSSLRYRDEDAVDNVGTSEPSVRPVAEETVATGASATHDIHPQNDYTESLDAKDISRKQDGVDTTAAKLALREDTPTQRDTPQEFIEAPQSSHNNLDATIKDSPAPTAAEIPPDNVPAPLAEMQEQQMHQANQRTQVASGSDEIAIKRPSQPPSIEQALPIEVTDRPQIGFCSAQNMHAAFERASKTSAALNSVGMGPPKAKMVNPATRGRSLQLTVAASNDAMAQSLRAMPPPALQPRITSRPVSRPPVTVAPEDAKSISADGVPLTGPWSRESFDLFGNWRPPGKATNAAPISG